MKDLPPGSTVHGYFDMWAKPSKAHAVRSIVGWQAEGYDGTLLRLHHALYI